MTVEITFRTLKGAVFKLPAGESETILDLKRKVAAEQKVDDYAAYRLIHKGKILQDDATISSANITSAGFVVVMPPKKLPTKPKPAPAATSPTSSKPSSASTPKPTDASSSAPSSAAEKSSDSSSPKSDVKMEETKSRSTETLATSTSSAPASSTADSSTAASALVTGSEYESSIKRICEMGFPEDQVKRAMRAAFNNPDRAVEFLFSGIPEIPEVTTPPAASSAPSASPSNPSSTDATRGTQTTSTPTGRREEGAMQGTPFDMFAPAGGAGPGQIPGDAGTGGGGGSESGNLAFLRDLPLFRQIRRLVQANPAALPQILQQLSSLHPDLIPLIDANQEEFSRLINEPLGEGENISDEAMEQLAQELAAGGGMSPQQGGEGMGNATQIYVTPEERDQINRLNDFATSIGLSQRQVLETWLACGRDEDLTANFLFDHADELRADRSEDAAQGDEGGESTESNQDGSNQQDPDPSKRDSSS